jgi:NhaP-type Na+/H+ or K+/H+ antiporter
LTFFAYYDYPWSWQFILVEILIIIVGRYLGTLGLVYFLSIFGHKRKVTFREICFIGYAGMIRGAIAFGLVLRLADYDTINSDSAKIITTTALTLVVLTTIFFGSLMPLVQKCLVPGVEKPEHEEI